MITLSIRPRTDNVERVLLNGGFDRKAFLRAASLVTEKVKASRRDLQGQSAQNFSGATVARKPS